MINENEIRKKLSLKKVLIPVLIGLFAASYVLYQSLTEIRFEKTVDGTGTYTIADGVKDVSLANPDHFVIHANGDYNRTTITESLARVDWGLRSVLMLLAALVFLVFRIVGYIMRIRILSDYKLNWRQSTNVILLWEFASALTPSVVGGAGIAIFFLGREKISLGKSTAMVMITSMLDELFFVLIVPIVFFITWGRDVFPASWRQEIMGFNLTAEGVFWVGYSFIFFLIALLIYAVFINPRGFKYLLLKVFSIKILQRWRYLVIQWGKDLVVASKEYRKKNIGFWLKTFAWTFFSWTSRFLLLNCLIMIVVPHIDQVFVYAKQLGMWIIMLISPTPGSSGLAELAFFRFFGDSIVPISLVGFLAILWRLLTYFPYLFAGAVILPTWLKNTSK